MTNFYIAEILVLPSELRLQANNESYLETLKLKINNYLKDKNTSNLLWFNQELESFKIELVRDIIREAQFANFTANNQLRVLILLNIETAGDPAQNALLKLIEEPPANTLIILPVFNETAILETIRSRTQLKRLQSSIPESIEKNTVNWPKDLAAAIALAEEYKDRSEALILIQTMLDNKKLSNKQRTALTRAYSDLNANLNVRLCLEHCFFVGL